MSLVRQALLFFSGLAAAVSDCTGATPPVRNLSTNVVVIGGGAAGAHAAVRLGDFGQDVLLVEMQPELVSFSSSFFLFLLLSDASLPTSSTLHIGSHDSGCETKGGAVNSYTSPTTGKAYEYGVQTFIDYGNASRFISRFGIPLGMKPTPALHALYADFATGQLLANYTGPSPDDLAIALQRFLTVAERYESLLVPGYFNFPEASSIPEDLLMNFGDFVQKYNISAAVPTIYALTASGLGRLVDTPTIWVMQVFGAQMGRLLVGKQAAFAPASGRNQDLYDAISAYLGNKVLYNTRAISSVRTSHGVTVTVQNHVSGETTVIHANKLLIAIQPVGTELAAFDLDAHEAGIFSKFGFTREYTCIVQHPSLPVNSSIFNLPLEAVSSKSFLQYPDFNFTQAIQAVDYDTNLFQLVVIGDERLGPTEFQPLAQYQVNKLFASGALAASAQTELNWLTCSNNGAMYSRVSVDDLRAGFIQDLYSLQGLRSTWYTGAAWASNYQTILWQYNELMLPKMLGLAF